LLELGKKIITTQTFLKYGRDNFYSQENLQAFIDSLSYFKISRLLDVDNFFAKKDLFYMWLAPDVEIEAIDKNSFAQKYPVVESLYSKIYSSLDECRFKSYDALFITADREPADFLKLLEETDGMSDNLFMFVGKKSELNFWLKLHGSVFKEIMRSSQTNGDLLYIKKRVPPESFACYVVTHKDVKLDPAALPEGYKIIHAGHATAKQEFDYLGDDTGDNISHLNRYLNEITALYWMWKNTRHTIIGLCHYRRFFTIRVNYDPNTLYQTELPFDIDKILTAQEAKEILRGCDVIIVKSFIFIFTQTELKEIVLDSKLNKYVENVFRKYIALRQPDYLEAFDYVSGSYSEFMYEMFITRRHVFEAYCEWLFSFLLDVTEEVLATTDIANTTEPRKYRSIGLISERLMTVWLIKNHLLIKMLPIMFRKYV
ncbi:MAG: DUF4422 domain-containing protein, partial [Selenomonadaceae bacterium]|nr:DUF4422 domain-containing protein [Selenomonadaceae bacterium]